ncbi:reverse transcriptase domain-containing protein [Tanacetum coccineum]
MDARSKNSTPRNEEICGNTAKAHDTDTRRSSDNVPDNFGAELNYQGLEKLILALVHTARRLRRYFQAHTVTVLTNSPIRQTLTKPKKSRRVAKWAIELGEHDIAFQKRGDETPKDFLTEVPPGDNNMEIEDRPNTKSKKTELSCEWNL